MMTKKTRLQMRLLAWYDRQGRSLPFRGTRDPYRVWLSEIMLQQTQTATVAGYYLRFLQRFPDVEALAAAEEQSVLKAWEGLGYYSRARNLLRTARIVSGELGGRFPDSAEGLQRLPGIGPYTAAAIASIAYGERVPAIDGNLTRVISRLYDVEEDVAIPSVRRRLGRLGLDLMPADRPGDMNQALMDLGATVCLPGTPDCERCPLSEDCLAFALGEPERLPLLPQRRPQKVIELSVLLLTCGGRVMVRRRQEALLRGLYVFYLHEGGAERAAEALGLAPGDLRWLRDARHVFTHRVWQMKLYHAALNERVKGGEWVTAEELAALPLPTAMRAAREEAMRLLKEPSGTG